METTSVSSSSAFLPKSPLAKTRSVRDSSGRTLKTNIPTRPLLSSGQPITRHTLQTSSTPKPKQSKSRNGCITCKGKRLKCDESKPSCEQCRKRNVSCGGYNKSFKWRSFEEASFTGRAAPKPKKVSSPPLSPRTPEELLAPPNSKEPQQQNGLVPLSPQQNPCSSHESEQPPSSSHGRQEALQEPSSPQEVLECEIAEPHNHIGPPGRSSSPEDLPSHDPVLTCNTSVLSPLTPQHECQQSEPPVVLSENGVSPLTFHEPQSLLSPLCSQKLLPGAEMQCQAFSAGVQLPRLRLQYHTGCNSLPTEDDLPLECETTPEDMSLPDDMNTDCIYRAGPLTDSWPFYTGAAADFLTCSSTDVESPKPWAQIMVADGSEEMLMLHFHRRTCGILSVKDGPSENPWRTAIWPLAQSSPQLYHALTCLTAFHSCKIYPALRMVGMKHMHQSVTSLAASLPRIGLSQPDDDGRSLEAALATTLVLAFSESWDQHISTGIKHLKGARYFVDQAICRQKTMVRQRIANEHDAHRMKFLCNSYIYMDVIARLTSLEESELADSTSIFDAFASPPGTVAEIDPLMGAARTLFPLIGHVASIIARVRKSDSNSFTLVSDALEMRKMVEHWQPPPSLSFATPEDPTSEVLHSLQTAEAYRWATLLYLHQSVPEIPSESAAILANRVLKYLATVPLSSRAIILQIYPLLAASCEIVAEAERTWIRNRWLAMMARMSIGNVDKCFEVVKEVWARRDAFEAARTDKCLREQALLDPHSDGLFSSLTDRSDEDDGLCNIWGNSVSVSADPGEWEKASARPGSLWKRRAMTGLPFRGRNNDSGRFDAICLNAGDREESMSQLPSHCTASMPCSMHYQPSKMSMEGMDAEYTVRGHLHWLGVMTDFGWEVFLG